MGQDGALPLAASCLALACYGGEYRLQSLATVVLVSAADYGRTII